MTVATLLNHFSLFHWL